MISHHQKYKFSSARSPAEKIAAVLIPLNVWLSFGRSSEGCSSTGRRPAHRKRWGTLHCTWPWWWRSPSPLTNLKSRWCYSAYYNTVPVVMLYKHSKFHPSIFLHLLLAQLRVTVGQIEPIAAVGGWRQVDTQVVHSFTLRDKQPFTLVQVFFFNIAVAESSLVAHNAGDHWICIWLNKPPIFSLFAPMVLDGFSHPSATAGYFFKISPGRIPIACRPAMIERFLPGHHEQKCLQCFNSLNPIEAKTKVLTVGCPTKGKTDCKQASDSNQYQQALPLQHSLTWMFLDCGRKVENPEGRLYFLFFFVVLFPCGLLW